MSDNNNNDELVSQFMAFTGCADTARAASYLEMSGGSVETAVGLYMEHQAGGAGAGAAGALGGGLGGGGDVMGDIRAPDATQTMRLMDDHGHDGGYMGLPMDPILQEQLAQSAFAAPSAFDTIRETINAAAAAGEQAEDEDMEQEYKTDDAADEGRAKQPNLADMFAAPDHLIFKEGGFEGARNMAKDNKRWLLVNLQSDSEFACHALNRDVWRDELVENLVRDGFIFWQAMNIAPEGQVYAQRYHVHDYPHIGIIDPRTRRLVWKKEGWTQQNPMTPELFAETVMDFCSRHSFDKPPMAPRPSSAAAASRPAKRPMHEMSEEEQMQAAMRASLQESPDNGMGGDDDDDNESYEMEDGDDGDIEYLGISNGGVVGDGDGDSKKPAAVEPSSRQPKNEPSLLDELLGISLGDEPEKGARIQIRMPDGKRSVRKFDASKPVKTIYAFIAQSSEEAKGGKEFVLMAGFPPKDLLIDIENSIESCKLSGQAITVRWK